MSWLCLGYFYHTLNHLALWQYIASTNAQHVILDGEVAPGEDMIIRVVTEDISAHANGTSAAGVLNGQMLVGRPTTSVLGAMLRHFGYDCTFFDWATLLRERGVAFDQSVQSATNPVGDYGVGRRATALGVRVD